MTIESLWRSLGEKVEGFVFKLQGPDHHARWMSTVIYNLKMKLVSKFIEMSDDEKEKATDFRRKS